MYETTSTTSSMLSGFAVFTLTIFALVVLVLLVLILWRIFAKAGQAGWKSLIPVYNLYILIKIVGLPGWYLILLFIPVVHFVVGIYIIYLLGRSFGMSDGLNIVTNILLPMIGLPVGPILLAFGSYTYSSPAIKTPAVTSPTPDAPAAT